MAWNLTPGSIAFTAIQSDGTTKFSFIALVPIPQGTRIYFTDAGWVSGTNNGFRDGPEGILFWSASTNIAAGTIISYEGTNTNGFFAASAGGPIVINTVTSGTGESILTESLIAAPSLSTNGDQIIAFQVADGFDTFSGSTRTLGGTGASAYQPIAAITTDGNSFSNATSVNDTALPDGLNETLGHNLVSALAIGTGAPSATANSGEIDNGALSLAGNGGSSLIVSPSDGAISFYVTNLNNWTLSDTALSPFSISGAITWQDTSLSGTFANDSLVGTSYDETFEGFAGNDTLAGGAGNDFLSGGADNDTISGDSGNDSMRGGTGNDTMTGGSGVDVFELDLYDTTFTFRAQRDVITDFSVAEDRISLGTNGPGSYEDLKDFALRVVPAGETYAGSAQIYRIWNGFEQSLTLAGVDVASLTASNFIMSTDYRSIQGGEFYTSTMFFGGVTNDNFTGTPGDDLLIGGNASTSFGGDTLNGGGGNDTIVAGSGNMIIGGNAGFDEVWYRTPINMSMVSNSAFFRDANANVLYSHNFFGMDKLVGSSGADTIAISSNIEIPILWGGDGDDILTGGARTNEIRGGQGNDTLNGGGANGVAMPADAGGSTLEVLFGDAGDDVVNVQTLTGQIASAFGGTGNDLLSGGAGNDRLQGDAGNDTIQGGNGSDTAVYSAALGQYSVTVNPDGSLTIAHNNAGTDGTDQVSGVEFFDFAGQIVAADTFTPSESAPSGADATLSILEDTPHTFSAGDFGFSDTDGRTLAAVKITTLPVAGSLTLNGSAVMAGQFISAANITAGLLVFTPAENANGNGYALFTFQVQDTGASNNLDLSANTIAFDVTPVNDAPTAFVINTVTTDEDTASSSVAIGASDVDGHPLTFSIKTGSEPQKGSVSFTGGSGGAFVYTPNTDTSGRDTFIILVSDGFGGTFEQEVTANITPINDVPTGAPTATLASGTEDQAYVVSASNLLQGFSDVDGDTLSVVNLTASSGTVTNNGDGTFTISAPANVSGLVTLTYDVTDGNGGSLTGQTRTFTRAAVNDAPTGSPTATLASGTEDQAYVVSASNLLQGFSDVDGDTLSVVNLTASSGTVTNNGDGTFTISAPANVSGLVTLTYDVTDGNGGSLTGLTRTFVRNEISNTAPTGSPTATLAAGSEDQAYTVPAADLLAGFTDADGDTLSVVNLTSSSGTVTNNGDGTFTISAPLDANGLVTLTYDVTDGNGGTVTGQTRTFTRTAVNDAPAAFVINTVTTDEDTASSPVNIGASDVDGNPLTFSIKAGSEPQKGSVSFTGGGGGTFVYTPNTGASGQDTFIILVSDGFGGTFEQEVTANITEVNDAPTDVILSNVVSSLNENTSTATRIRVADISVTDDGVGTNTLELTGSDAAFFEIDDNSVYLKAGTVLNFESKASYDVAVTADDSAVGGTPDATSATLSLSIADINEVPTALALSASTVGEYAARETLVGRLTGTDPDSASTLSYSIVDSAGGRFKIVGEELRVSDGLLLDYEQGRSHVVSVRVTDSQGLALTRSFTISVRDINPETVTGDSGTDVFVGSSFADRLLGGGGADYLNGALGNDWLQGDSGNDRLIGSFGRDTLTGGAGADRFEFDAVGETGRTSSTRDIIRDFTHNSLRSLSDQIDLATIDANGTAAGNTAFVWRGTSAFTGGKGQLRYKQENLSGTSNDRTIIEGDINGDRVADFQIELTGLKNLVSADFVL